MSSVLPKSLLRLISEFEKLPGVGPKSAARMAYYLLRAPERESLGLAKAASDLKKSVTTCSKCFNISEREVCFICDDYGRDSKILCVVEEPLDVVAIEKSGSYSGLYHVLGGVISPVNGIGPEELRMSELERRIKTDLEISEIIIGTNPNLEGEATAMYVSKLVHKINLKIRVSRLARGLPTGADLEYADSLTLKRSMEGRMDF